MSGVIAMPPEHVSKYSVISYRIHNRGSKGGGVEVYEATVADDARHGT
jgi:hypothetical protein